jgi:hypothetical protein
MLSDVIVVLAVQTVAVIVWAFFRILLQAWRVLISRSAGETVLSDPDIDDVERDELVSPIAGVGVFDGSGPLQVNKSNHFISSRITTIMNCTITQNLIARILSTALVLAYVILDITAPRIHCMPFLRFHSGLFSRSSYCRTSFYRSPHTAVQGGLALLAETSR